MRVRPNKGDDYVVPFQFMPKIVNESNASDWLEINAWDIEPIKVHKGSTGRKLGIEWEYIASGSGDWVASKIGTILRSVKSYFFKFDREWYPVVTLKCGIVVPVETNFRVRDINVTYSPEQVSDPDNVNFFHPLYTKVSLTLELATTLNLQGDQSAEATAAVAKLNIQPLGAAVFEWY